MIKYNIAKTHLRGESETHIRGEVLSCGGSGSAYGRYIHKHIHIHKCTTTTKELITLHIVSLESNGLVHWIPIHDAQLRSQGTAVASYPTEDRPGLAPTHLPGLQAYSREKRHHEHACEQRGL